jgi:hypothetical protein
MASDDVGREELKSARLEVGGAAELKARTTQRGSKCKAEPSHSALLVQL